MTTTINTDSHFTANEQQALALLGCAWVTKYRTRFSLTDILGYINLGNFHKVSQMGNKCDNAVLTGWFAASEQIQKKVSALLSADLQASIAERSAAAAVENGKLQAQMPTDLIGKKFKHPKFGMLAVTSVNIGMCKCENDFGSTYMLDAGYVREQ